MLSLNNLKARKNNRTIASRLQAKYVRGNTACADHEHTGWNLSPFTIVTPMVAPSAAFSRVSNFCHWCDSAIGNWNQSHPPTCGITFLKIPRNNCSGKVGLTKSMLISLASYRVIYLKSLARSHWTLQGKQSTLEHLVTSSHSPRRPFPSWTKWSNLSMHLSHQQESRRTTLTTVPSSRCSLFDTRLYPNILGNTIRHPAQYRMPTSKIAMPMRQYLWHFHWVLKWYKIKRETYR